MKETYLSNEEYPTYFSNLEGLRMKIACDLFVQPGMQILDLATGYGYFAIEVAKREPSVQIVGIDISQSDVNVFNRNVKRLGLGDRLKILRMDATQMDFPDEEFDMVINFLGLEDIHMTRGMKGVKRTFSEVARVLKPEGYFSFTIMPPEEMETEAERIEVETFSWLCGCTWLSTNEYEEMLKDNRLKLLSKKRYRTGKKLTSEQAREEIRFACENVPKIYGVRTPSFEEAWARFGSRIENHGMGHYSKVVLFIAQKVE